MAKVKTRGIRAGDVVRVIKPDFFVRCGYPITVSGELAAIIDNNRGDIVAFLRGIGITPTDITVSAFERCVEDVARPVAYASALQKGFGGNHRTIHTAPLPEFAGAELTVHGVRFCKTGERVRGSYYDEDGPEPNYLANEKTHRILSTWLVATLPGRPYPDTLEIEADNVQLVKQGTPCGE